MIRLGLILLFSGDKRKVKAPVKNVTSFSAVSHVMKQGDTTVTSSNISDSPTSAGNVLISATIGGYATIPPGNYRYYVTGTHSGRNTTFYWDVVVLAKDLSQSEIIPDEDYNPYLDEIVMFEGDYRSFEVNIPSLEFSTATGVLKQDDDDKTSTYCNSSVSVSESTITSHVIGGAAAIPAGEYGYFLSGTHSDGEMITTWHKKIIVLPKQSAI